MFFKKFLKRKAENTTSEVTINGNKTSNEYKVSLDNDYSLVIKTDNQLSDDTKNSIADIIKEGLEHNEEPSDICIKIMMKTSVFDIMVLNIYDTTVELIF